MRAVILLCLLDAAFARSPYNWYGLSRNTPDSDPNAASVCQMDQASCGCCLMQQQIHRMRMHFNITLNALEREHIKTQKTLNSMKASRTAFSVALHNEKTLRCYGPFSDDRVIVYKHVFLNMGYGYDVGAGIFIVVHSGVYSLALTVYSDSGAPGSTQSVCAGLQVNGEVIVGSKDNTVHDQEDSASFVVAKQLHAGDQVAVILPSGCFLCDDKNHYNTFSVFLLYATE